MRSHDQYNTTIYGLDDRYRGVFGRRDVLMMNEGDMARLGLVEGDLVDVETALEHAHPERVVRALTVIRYDLPPNCCGAYYPESQALVALGHIDKQSGTPSYKSVPVRVSPATIRPAGETAIAREGLTGVVLGSTAARSTVRPDGSRQR
jgi:anaerobic selenocysteine-containing dehydrogenase